MKSMNCQSKPKVGADICQIVFYLADDQY